MIFEVNLPQRMNLSQNNNFYLFSSWLEVSHALNGTIPKIQHRKCHREARERDKDRGRMARQIPAIFKFQSPMCIYEIEMKQKQNRNH